MKDELTVEKFLSDRYLFVAGDEYEDESGYKVTVGLDVSTYNANIKARLDDKRFVLSAKCLDDKRFVLSAKCLDEKKVGEYIKIENPCIFSLKDDFESGNLYSLDSNKQATCITELLHLTASALNNNIYRKQYWYSLLDGTEKNAVWCHVWEIDKLEHWSYPVITPIISTTKSGGYKALNEIEWPNANPIPQEMVDFINKDVLNNEQDNN